MFATDELFEDVNDQGLWDSFQYPKYSAEYEGSFISTTSISRQAATRMSDLAG